MVLGRFIKLLLDEQEVAGCSSAFLVQALYTLALAYADVYWEFLH